MTRVAVVGPGAIGGAAAAMAQRAGAELVLCGRTPLERLVIGDEVVAGPVLTDPAAVPWRADVVLFAVKAHQTEAASGFLRALAGPETVVAVLQNGVEQRELVAPYAAGATVLPAVVWLATEVTAPGHVRVVTPPRFLLPREPGAERSRTCSRAPRSSTTSSRQAWHKLTVNAVAGLMALTGRRAAMFASAQAQRLARALAAEALAVARAEGADLDDAVADEIMRWFAELPRRRRHLDPRRPRSGPPARVGRPQRRGLPPRPRARHPDADQRRDRAAAGRRERR